MTTVYEYCADCGSNVTDLRPKWTIGTGADTVRVCGTCLEVRMGWVGPLTNAEDACLRADTLREQGNR